MARLPALIDNLAKHDTRGKPTVELIARTIREDGLIRTTKRGRGAAEMSASDAVALLIGLCVAETPSAAPQAVRIFLSLVPTIPLHADTGQRADELPSPLSHVAKASSFGDALSALIAEGESIVTLSNKSIQNMVLASRSRGGINPKASDLDRFTFSVGFQITERRGYIAVNWADKEDGSTALFGRSFGELSSVPKRQPNDARVDKIIEVNLGANTFIRLGRLLKVQTPPLGPEETQPA